MARALFKSWFVDFAPVRAKAEGRDPGLPKEIADLFPDSFKNSELGEIPKGWRVGSVSDVAGINTWTLDRTDPLPVIDYIEISEVMRGEIASTVRYERGSEPSRARRRLKHGDTVLSTVRPDRRAHFLCLDPPETLVASTGFAVLSPREGDWAFLYAAVTRREVCGELGRLADGGAYPAVRAGGSQRPSARIAGQPRRTNALPPLD
jgi:type I restriction enzyme S subunit